MKVLTMLIVFITTLIVNIASFYQADFKIYVLGTPECRTDSQGQKIFENVTAELFVRSQKVSTKFDVCDKKFTLTVERPSHDMYLEVIKAKFTYQPSNKFCTRIVPQNCQTIAWDSSLFHGYCTLKRINPDIPL
uniref:Transmembrane protein n=1 Tax=Strongyloides papillosus TaxID=174720 RepID=A0A0N5BEU5_STREA